MTTLFGRRRQIPELKARNWQVRSLGERLAVNTVIQGTAADVHEARDDRAATAPSRARAHDPADPHDPRRAAVRGPAEEFEACALVEREMIAPWPHDPPLAVEAGVGQTWLDAK